MKNYAKSKWKPRELSAIPDLGVQNLSIGKSYQQDYDQLPREIRTWESNRLSHSVGEVMQHTDRYVTVNTAPLGAPYPVRRLAWWIFERLVHRTAPAARCTLAQTKSPPPVLTEDGQNPEDAGVTTTSGSVPTTVDTSSLQHRESWGASEQVFTPPLPF